VAHNAHDAPKETRQFTLPVLIFGLPELRRLHRELEALEEFMRGAAVRAPGTQVSLPRLSRLCEALAAENHLNLLQPTDRKLLQAFIVKVEHTAPQVHVSFASDPSSAFTAKVVTWLRGSVHPWSLLQVGLQPTIAAGCVVRTSNRVFDFSLRERFVKSETKLLDAFEAEAPPDQVPLEAATTTPEPAVAAETPAPTPLAPTPPQPANHLDEAAAATVAMELASVLVPEEVTDPGVPAA
jgi:hypothetical protein